MLANFELLLMSLRHTDGLKADQIYGHSLFADLFKTVHFVVVFKRNAN